MNTTNTNVVSKLQQMSKEIQALDSKTESITNELKQIFSKVDALIEQQAQEWAKFRSGYFTKLVEQLKTTGVGLNQEEISVLQNDTIASSVKEKLLSLQKSGVDLPSTISDFAVGTYYAIVSSFSRNFKIDNKEIKPIVSKIGPLFDEEGKAAVSLRENHSKEHKQIADQIQAINAKTKDLKLPELDSKELDSINVQTTELLHETEKAKKAPAQIA